MEVDRLDDSPLDGALYGHYATAMVDVITLISKFGLLFYLTT